MFFVKGVEQQHKRGWLAIFGTKAGSCQGLPIKPEVRLVGAEASDLQAPIELIAEGVT